MDDNYKDGFYQAEGALFSLYCCIKRLILMCWEEG